MKKLLAFIFVFCSLFCFCGVNVLAAEETTEPGLVEIVGKTYTYTDEYGEIKLTIVSDILYTLFAKLDETEATFSGTYILEENLITLYLADQIFGMYILDNETMTMAEYYEEEIVYPCYVTLPSYEYGDVEADILEGNIGDIVTLKVKPQVFCKLSYIKVNGVDLIPGENGSYSFALIEGENKIEAEFLVNEEDMKVIAGLINSANKGSWEEIFNIKNLFNLIQWFTTLLFSGGFLTVLLKSKKIQAKTTDEVCAATDTAIETAISNYLDTKILPILKEYDAEAKTIEEIVETLAHCMTIAQENTPESRLEIVKQLSKIRKIDNKTVDEVRDIINKEVARALEEHNQKVKAVDELEKINNSIKVEDLSGRI